MYRKKRQRVAYLFLIPAMVLFLLVLVVTLIQFKGQEKYN